MGMSAIFLNGAESFEHIVKTLSTEGPMGNLMIAPQAVSEKKSYKVI